MQLSFTTVLLLMVALQSIATAQDEDFSGSGYGGSGDGCIRPPDPFTPTIKTEAEGVMEVRCHLACIEQVEIFVP